MVTKRYFRIIFCLIIFLLKINYLASENNMDTIEVNITEAKKLYNLNKIKIVDIRTIKEWKMTGVIPESLLINMHNDDYTENLNFTGAIENILLKYKNTKVAFICASGARSEIVVNYFKKKNFDNVFHIPDGILGKNKDGWLYLNFPIEAYNPEKRYY